MVHPVFHPRMRNVLQRREIPLKSYEKLNRVNHCLPRERGFFGGAVRTDVTGHIGSEVRGDCGVGG